MMYKNSFRLIFSNFHLVWKLLAFLLVTTLISSGFSYLTSLPIINVLVENGLPDFISTTYSNLVTNLNLSEFFVDISDIARQFFGILSNHMEELWIYIVLFLFGVFILSSIIRGFYLMATCNVLYYYMSDNANHSFTSSLFKNFGKNFRYQLFYLITILPIKLMIFYLVFLSFNLLKIGGIVSVFAPLISIAIYTILNAVRITIFTGWIPSIVICNYGVAEGLVKGFKAIKKRLAKTFSNSIGVVLTIIFMNVFVGLFTFGVAWFIVIPASYLFVSIFNMVSYYSSQGMRFYVDPTTVIAPKRMEQIEKFNNLKDIV